MTPHIGMRMRFVGPDDVFHFGERKGRVGTIVADATFDPKGANFSDGTCCWQLDGDEGVFIVDLKHLREEN